MYELTHVRKEIDKTQSPIPSESSVHKKSKPQPLMIQKSDESD
jgi:hypothetical protein